MPNACGKRPTTHTKKQLAFFWHPVHYLISTKPWMHLKSAGSPEQPSGLTANGMLVHHAVFAVWYASFDIFLSINSIIISYRVYEIISAKLKQYSLQSPHNELAKVPSTQHARGRSWCPFKIRQDLWYHTSQASHCNIGFVAGPLQRQ